MTVSADMADYERFRAWAKTADKKIAAAQRRRIREIGRSLMREMLEEGAEGMPASGGLQERLRGSKAHVAMLAKGIQLRLGERGAAIGAIDRNSGVRHPVYGNRGVWSVTDVEGGSWSKVFGEKADEVRAQIREEIEQILREAGR